MWVSPFLWIKFFPIIYPQDKKHEEKNCDIFYI